MLHRSAFLIVSSPSHLTNYFDRLGVDLPETILVENKQVMARIERPSCSFAERRPPWRIGWYGQLRCIESFRLLVNLAQRALTSWTSTYVVGPYERLAV